MSSGEVEDVIETAKELEGKEAEDLRSSVGNVLERHLKGSHMAISQPMHGDFHGGRDAFEELATTAIREASALQNFTVYAALYHAWYRTSDLDNFLDVVEAYVEERGGWDERGSIPDTDIGNWTEEINEYGDGYINDIVVDVLVEADEQLRY